LEKRPSISGFWDLLQGAEILQNHLPEHLKDTIADKLQHPVPDFHVDTTEALIICISGLPDGGRAFVGELFPGLSPSQVNFVAGIAYMLLQQVNLKVALVEAGVGKKSR
jgi:hypothetical protein